MKKLVLSVIVLCLSISVFAQKSGRVIISESDFDFSFNDDLTEVTINRFKYDRYNDPKNKYDGKVIEIPSKIQGATVVAIGNEAFTCKGENISGLWIPDSVTKISSYAFDSAYFSSIRLPEGLKTITVGMFQSCKAKSVTIPSSVTRIRSQAFCESQIESITIPKDCIIEGGDYEHMTAFQNCPKLKTVTFPSGHVYFDARPIDQNNNWMWSGEGVFRDCNSLTSIVIPKGFEAFYISDSDSANYTLADYFSGEKIKTSAATLKTLKSVKVRNAAVVEHEEYLAAYNQAIKSGDYTRAQLLAKQYKEKYSYYKSDEWTTRYEDALEKPYLDEYNKAVASKDFQKAKKIINEFIGKISSDSSLSSLESKWDDMLFDVDCKMYLPAYVEKLEKKGSVTQVNSNLQFKIPLTKNLYENSKFNFTDSEGNSLWTVGYTLFLKKIKEFTGKDYQIYDSYSDPHLYRNATAEEVSAYHQVIKDAVKYFMEDATRNGTLEKDGSNFVFKIYLSKDAYSYSNSTFTVKDASGTAYALIDKDFLAYAKEVCGTEYNLKGSYNNNSSYLYRNATEAEISAYHQVRKDAVKYFMDGVVKNGKFVMNNKQLMFKIYFPNETYSHRYYSVTVKDSSGKEFTFRREEFLDYVKEACGTQYSMYTNDSNPYLYRDATEEETVTYHNQRKEAVKLYMDESIKNGVVEKDGSKYLFNISISNDVYGGFYNKTFTLKDSSGNAYVLANEIFLDYVKEIYGTEYDIYNIYNYGNYVSSYFSRKATDEEIAEYYRVKKEAVKQFMDSAANVAVIERDGSNLLVKINLSNSTYRNNVFTIKHDSGKSYSFIKDDFLSYVKEVCGIRYRLYENYYGSYLYVTANEMLQHKCNVALQDGSLHTNLAYKFNDEWTLPVELDESKEKISVKSFKVKKSIFENNGFKQKDVIKKIVMSDAAGAETEVSWNDLLKIPAPCTLTFTIERGEGKKAKTFVVRIPVEWNVDEMKTVKDIVDFKCLLAFLSGNLHTDLACAVDKKWLCVAEFAESNGAVIIKSFRGKKSALEKSGLKTKDVIKSITRTDESGKETELNPSDLLKIQAPATLTFTVERGSGKKMQLLTINVPVEWNAKELKNIW